LEDRMAFDEDKFPQKTEKVYPLDQKYKGWGRIYSLVK
jgi:hypothetical protein